MVKEIEIPSDIKSFSEVELFIRNACDLTKISRRLYGKIYVSISELVTNAIVHGNQFSVNKCVKIRCVESDQCFEISVQDEGNGFDIESLPDPLMKENLPLEEGRGIFFVKQFSDEFHFADNGRKITLIFYKES